MALQQFYLAQYKEEGMAVVYWVSQVWYANFNNTHMVLMEIYSLFMVTQPTLSDNNLWVLLEVLQPLQLSAVGKKNIVCAMNSTNSSC